MNFLEFLHQAKNKEFWHKRRVLCFIGQDYPFLFFNQLFDFLEHESVLPAEHKNLIINITDKIKLVGALQQSFLGQKTFYWLGELKVGKTDKKGLDFCNFLLEYKGPNFITFYLNDEKLPTKFSSALKKVDYVQVEEGLDKLGFQSLVKFFDQKLVAKKLSLAKKIITNNSDLSLDGSCMLMQYLDLINIKAADDFSDYLSAVLVDEQSSLHMLSQYFFAKQPASFFKIWSQVYSDYPEMFWISFWSEQIWRAFHVVKYLKKKDFVKARSMTFRLPFMFIKRDWKNFSLNRLANYFQFLYNIDYAVKNGSAFCSLDLFYFNHFSK